MQAEQAENETIPAGIQSYLAEVLSLNIERAALLDEVHRHYPAEVMAIRREAWAIMDQISHREKVVSQSIEGTGATP